MNWESYLGINLIFSTLRETLNKKIADKTDPVVSVFYIFWINTGLFFLYHIYLHGFVFSWNIYTIFSGVLFTVAWVAYYKAVKISLSQSILFSSYSLIIIIILSALFLGESRYLDVTKFSGMQVILGITLAISAMWYLLHDQRKKQQLLEWHWFAYILITIVTIGVGSFITLYSLKILTTTDIFNNQAVGSVPAISILAFLGKRSKLKIKPSKLWILFCNSITSVIAVIAFYGAARLAPATILYPIQTVLLIISTMVVGFVVYKENHILTGNRIVGLSLGLFGVVLLALAK